MKRSQSLYQSIFDYYSRQVRQRLYQKDGRLPPIGEICSLFDASAGTVRKALLLLQEEGYVRLSRGRVAEVVWDQDHAALDMASHLNAVEDLYRFMRLFFPPIWTQGLFLLSGDELDSLDEIASNLEADRFRDLFRYFRMVMAPLENQVLIHLYYSIDSYMRYPFLGDEGRRPSADPVRERLLRITAICRRRDYRLLEAEVEELLDSAIPRFQRLREDLRPEGRQPGQALFRCSAYQGRSQFSRGIAIDLLHRIHAGEYPPAACLPPVAELAQRYAVSVHTIRRTLRLLNQIGAARTINGHGTQVSARRDPAVEEEQIHGAPGRDNLMLYLQSLQIMAMTCGTLARWSFPLLEEGARAKLREAVSRDLELGTPVSTPVDCWREMIRVCGIDAAREVNDYLAGMMVWGYSLRCSNGAWTPRWIPLLKAVREALEQEDGELYASSLRSLFCLLFHWSKETLVKAGIPEAERLLTPQLPTVFGLALGRG